MRHQRAAVRQRDAGNQRVICADPLSTRFQVRADGPGLFGCLIVQPFDLERRAELPEYSNVLSGSRLRSAPNGSSATVTVERKIHSRFLEAKVVATRTLRPRSNSTAMSCAREDNASQISPVFRGRLGGTFQIRQASDQFRE